MNTFYVSGWIDTETKEVLYIGANSYYKSIEEANIVLNKFPKSYKVKVAKIYSTDPNISAMVTCSSYLGKDEVNKGKNETGIKRMKSFLKKVSYEFVENQILNPATVEQMKALLVET